MQVYQWDKVELGKPNNGTNGIEGEDAINGELAGEGGGETNNDSEAVGGNGGDGGSPNEAADAGENGSGGESHQV